MPHRHVGADGPGVIERYDGTRIPVEPRIEYVQPDAVIPPDVDPDDDWDQDWDDDDQPECSHGRGLGDLARRLVDEQRHAAERLDALTDPAAREVGRWLRRRAQQATIDMRSPYL